MTQIAISLGQHSSAGVKPVNQDFHGAVLAIGRERVLKGIAVALADGISSSTVSQIAAESAVKSFLSDYYCTPDGWTVKTAASRVISASNAWLHGQTRRAQLSHDMDRGYVCTFSALVLKARHAHLFHIGDARVYRLQGDTLDQLTEDHRVTLSARETYLGRALGMAAHVEIDYRALPLSLGDIFVLATDGVYDFVPARQITTIIAQAPDLDIAARQITAAALAAGSDDNLTVQILRVTALPDTQPEALFDDGLLDGATELPLPEIPEPPCDFDGYRLLRRLHGNARSHIFLAQDPDTGAQVVLKLPSVDLRASAEYRRRLMMEDWVARRISSPHVLAAATPRPRRYLYSVAEFIEGQTLRQWMHDTPEPTLEQLRDIAGQISTGLRALHRRAMIHQDLRPENVMITPDGTVKIIDLGAVRIAGVAEAARDLDTEILGTLQYTAPEYFLGRGGTEASDLWSLAAIVYEMATGRLPYGTAISRARSPRAQAKLRYLRAEQLPEWMDAALARALSPDPRTRPQALSEFLADLRRPGPGFRPRASLPLTRRNPQVFWQVLCLGLALALLASLAR